MVETEAELLSISPLFIVRNLHETIGFYRDCLGFELEFIGPAGDEYFAIITRDSIAIFIKEITPEVGPLPNPQRHPWAAWDAYVYTKDPDALAMEFNKRAKMEIASVYVNDDKLRGFELVDPNGYVLYFGRLA